MRSVEVAVAKRFTDAGTLHDLFPGGYDKDRHPERKQGSPPVTYPYVVAQFDTGNTDTQFGGVGYGDVSVRFQMVGDDPVAVAAAADTLHGLFRNTLLTLTSGQCVNCRALHEPKSLPLEMGLGEGSKDVWTWVATYVYTIRN